MFIYQGEEEYQWNANDKYDGYCKKYNSIIKSNSIFNIELYHLK